MRRVAALIVAVVLAGLAGSAGERLAAAKAPKAESAVLALVQDRLERTQLAWLDPVTLRRLPRRAVTFRFGAWGAAFSPSGRMVALGGLGADGIRIVDIERMKLVGRVARRPFERNVVPLAWPVESRLLALDYYRQQRAGVTREEKVLVVDPLARRVVAVRPLGGLSIARARAGREVVLLLEPREGIAPARIAVAAPDGTVRTVVVDGILAGNRPDPARDDQYRSRSQSPGLAVDAAARRAFVVGAGALVAEVDLDTLAVSYHELATPVSLLGRLRDWLEPAARAKATIGWSRHGAWLGDGLVAVSGSDYDAVRSTQAGFNVVDTRTWTVRAIEPRASYLVVAGDLLLAAGAARDGRADTEAGMGVTAYTRDGRAVWHAFGDEPVWWLQVAAGYAYRPGLESYPPTVRVIELSSGAVHEVRGELPTLIAQN